jgi:hypothetical protein
MTSENDESKSRKPGRDPSVLVVAFPSYPSLTPFPTGPVIQRTHATLQVKE